MRFFAPIVALFAAVAVAQTSSSSQNQISIPEGGLKITTGSNTIKWTNPSSGTVTIKLQQGSTITPNSGIVVASGIPASAGTATFNIQPSEVNTFQYVLEIIDESNPNNYNFSTNFGITGATGSASTTGSASASASSTASSVSVTSSASASSSSASASSSSSASASKSSSSASASSSSASSASRTSSTSATAVPTSNAASTLQIQGGLIALVAAVAAF